METNSHEDIRWAKLMCNLESIKFGKSEASKVPNASRKSRHSTHKLRYEKRHWKISVFINGGGIGFPKISIFHSCCYFLLLFYFWMCDFHHEIRVEWIRFYHHFPRLGVSSLSLAIALFCLPLSLYSGGIDDDESAFHDLYFFCFIVHA